MKRRLCYVSAVSGRTFTLSPVAHDRIQGGGGVGLAQVTVVTHETSPQPGFWPAATSECASFVVTVERVS